MELDDLFQAQRQLSEKDLIIYNAELQKKSKSVGLAYFLLIFFGWLGLHKFYLGKIGEGIVYLIVGTIDFIFLRVIILGLIFTRYDWEPSTFIIILFSISAIFLMYDLFTLSTQIVEQEKILRINLLSQFGILDEETIENEDFINDYFKDDSFIDNNDGTVTHKPTGLMWQRFSIGETWNGETCVGNPIQMSWDEAMMLKSDFAGYNDWRLPTKEALMTLVSANKNKKRRLYWSSSPSADYFSSAWYVDFVSGLSYQHNKGYDHFVRLVRKVRKA